MPLPNPVDGSSTGQPEASKELLATPPGPSEATPGPAEAPSGPSRTSPGPLEATTGSIKSGGTQSDQQSSSDATAAPSSPILPSNPQPSGALSEQGNSVPMMVSSGAAAPSVSTTAIDEYKSYQLRKDAEAAQESINTSGLLGQSSGSSGTSSNAQCDQSTHNPPTGYNDHDRLNLQQAKPPVMPNSPKANFNFAPPFDLMYPKNDTYNEHWCEELHPYPSVPDISLLADPYFKERYGKIGALAPPDIQASLKSNKDQNSAQSVMDQYLAYRKQKDASAAPEKVPLISFPKQICKVTGINGRSVPQKTRPPFTAIPLRSKPKSRGPTVKANSGSSKSGSTSTATPASGSGSGSPSTTAAPSLGPVLAPALAPTLAPTLAPSPASESSCDPTAPSLNGGGGRDTKNKEEGKPVEPEKDANAAPKSGSNSFDAMRSNEPDAD